MTEDKKKAKIVTKNINQQKKNNFFLYNIKMNKKALKFGYFEVDLLIC